MSKIGRRTISLPSEVSVEINDQVVMVKGPKGQVEVPRIALTTVKVIDQELVVERVHDQDQAKANHGLARSLLNNAVIGVTAGFKITLKLIGTGYRVSKKGTGLSMTLGYSHPVEVETVPGVTLQIEGNDTIFVEGIDKQVVGQLAANIRAKRPPEPYKGKGIHYLDEQVVRKVGKAAQ